MNERNVSIKFRMTPHECSVLQRIASEQEMTVNSLIWESLTNNYPELEELTDDEREY